MDNENIALSNCGVVCSEATEDDVSLTAKFIICDFFPNFNDLMLNRKTISNWLNTLITQPVVGELGVTDAGVSDFESHNLFPVKRVAKDGSVYQDTKFFTSAMGVFTDVSIENIKNKEYIVATAKIWKRFPEFCAVIKRRIAEDTLHTSFEIAVKNFHIEKINGKKIKVVDDAVFLGHALLGSKITPAYADSRMIEVASQNENQDLINAIVKDIENISPEKEGKILENDLNKPVETQIATENTNVPVVEQNKENEILQVANVTPENGEKTEPVTSNENKENTKEVSAITMYDLYKSIRQAVSEKINKDRWDFDIYYLFPNEKIAWVRYWDDASELDIHVFTYTVENDVVAVGEPTAMKLTVSVAEINKTVAELNTKLQEKDNSLIKASQTIQTLNTTVATLTPYKDKFEKTEQDRIAKELADKQTTLKAYALKSGYIFEKELAESDDIKQMIEKVDEVGIKNVIAERFMKSLEKPQTKEIETSTANVPQITPKANITNDEDNSETVDYKSFIKSYLRK
jgi:hypothetical protein